MNLKKIEKQKIHTNGKAVKNKVKKIIKKKYSFSA
jgi:hypothetical protein